MDLLKDNPRNLFWKFLIPAVSSAIAVAAYSFVDTIAIGHGVGPEGTAACAIILPLFTISHFIALLCGVGGSVLMSRARGAGNKEKGDAYFTASLLYALIATCIVWALGVLFQKPLYRLFGADEILLPYAYDYGKWIMGAFPSFVMVYFLGAFIRTDGSPSFVMFVTLLGGVINIIGDFVLVFPLNMGMEGAAIATIAGSVAQTLCLIGYILLRKTSLRLAKPYQWHKAVRNTTVLGIGAGISQIASTVVTYIINNQIMRYSGPAALAVYGMMSTVVALFLSIFSGVGEAAQPIVSVNFGAGKPNRYRATGKLGLKTAAVMGLACLSICALFPGQMSALFMKVTPEIAEIAPYIIRVYAVAFVPMAVNLFATAYLQSVSLANKATVVSMLRGLILSSILLYVLPLILGGNGIWWAVTLAEALAALVALWYLLPELRGIKTK